MHGTIKQIARQSNPRGPRTRTKKTDPQPIVFGDVARLAYPVKTLEALGFATGCSRSAIATYLNGSREAPAWVLAIVFAELMRQLAAQHHV